ncbi:hypothetical protein FOXB_07328 [Fusarium oxysporum f. sp. conglutinans Fo5176]|uniref:Uncharacterized protein n=1 Tax=Fusarium oxysporum (strain Fo5176) TaxID=660025 RepID=F9FLP8_FUSOF|nr:hypothetical protein FOXB_07328 [Fusarium oxysporum f. sp. conglutinans Fo5176]
MFGANYIVCAIYLMEKKHSREVAQVRGTYGSPLHVFDYSKDASDREPELIPADEAIKMYESGKGLNIPMGRMKLQKTG